MEFEFQALSCINRRIRRARLHTAVFTPGKIQFPGHTEITNLAHLYHNETTDSSNKEQAVVFLRHVDNNLDVHEEFVDLYEMENIEANTFVSVLLDVLQQLNLSIHNVRDQCYDGASSMSGRKGGVAKQLCDREPRALYMHCYGHALNLACNDSIRQCKLMRDALDSSQEIIKLVKFSACRVCFNSSRQSWPQILQM